MYARERPGLETAINKEMIRIDDYRQLTEPNSFGGQIRHIAFLALMILMAACSSDNVPDPTNDNKAISFVGGLQEEQAVTRAAQGLEDVLTNKTFKVWSYKNDGYDAPNYTYTSYQTVMPGYTVNWTANTAYTTTSNTNDWEYVAQGTGTNQEIKYWDYDAKAYRFFAYALGNATADPATSPATVTETGGTVSDAPAGTEVKFTSTVDASSVATVAAAPYISRLWFSTNTPADPDHLFGKPVQLQFVKPFARVRFMFTFVEGLSFGREKLKNISFLPTANVNTIGDNDDTNDQIIATAGTVTVSYPLKGTATTETWTTTNTTGIKNFDIDYYEPITPDPDPDPTATAAFNANAEKWYYVLPAQNQGSYTLQVAVVSEEIKTAVVPEKYMSWKAGYEYTYKFKITESGGITMDVIQVAINDWGNRKTSNHTVYNW